MLVDRYTLITLPALLLMLSMAWSKLGSIYFKVFFVLLFVILSVRVYHRYYNKYKKPEYRELSIQIMRENPKTYPVLSREAWHINYFFRKYNAGYEVLHTDSLSEDWLKYKDKFWVILPRFHLNDSQKISIDAKFEVEKELTFYEMSAILYGRISHY